MGFANAMEEIMLVALTTLAPSGVVAASIILVYLMVSKRSAEEKLTIERCLICPFLLVVLGLVAASTHLGSPENALYVLNGVGRSPLSNEAAALIIYLGVLGVYWLTGFSERPLTVVRAILRPAGVLCGILALVGMALAYEAETIQTWSTWQNPVGLVLTGFVGGPPMVGLAMSLGRSGNPLLRLQNVGDSISTTALVASIGVFVSQGVAMSSMANSFGTAFEHVPQYYGMLVAYVLLCVVGLLLARRAYKLAGEGRRKAVIAYRISGSLVILAGIFIIRFAFYMSYLTV